ncbi:MAG: squalene/phytoene synthase family protein [Verrucomicrobiota bacterium]
MISRSHLDLLKSVSRSFYLSIRFLPPEMREPIALGYLLARLTDTVADAEGLEQAARLENLKAIRVVIQEQPNASADQVTSLAPAIKHEGEKELVRRSGELIDWYQGIDPANRSHLSEVILTIIHGQIWDATYFDEGQPTACQSGEELLRYTYWVAGCVGEFWTKVGFTNLGEGFAFPDKASMMLVEGRKLGQGLQLINILRDLHEDLPSGRIYLPEDELRNSGWDGKSGLTSAAVEPVFLKWIDQCEDFLALSEPYSAAIRNYRVAFCTRLPMELAKKTAASLRGVGCESVMTGQVKSPRSEVWNSMARVGCC